MGYRNKYGITKIRNHKINELQINWDYDFSPKRKYPVLFLTPNTDDLNVHYHVPLSKREAKKLSKWLIDFLKDVNTNGRKRSTTKRSRSK